MDDRIEVPLQCVLHVCGNEEYDDDDAVVPFSARTWGKAADIAQARRKIQKRSKYSVILDSINFEGQQLPHYGFHRGCYSKFTAYQIQATAKEPSEAAVTVQTRSTVEKLPIATTSITGVLERKCLFCQGPNRKHFKKGFETLAACETMQAQDSITSAARKLEDKEFLREYEHIDFIAKEVQYHNTCRVRYLSKGAKVQPKEEAAANAFRRDSAFNKLLSYINSEIFLKDCSKKLLDVNEIYTTFLTEEGFNEPKPSPQHLLSKIKEYYGSKLQVHQESKKQGVYISISKDAMSNEIKNVALFLRAKIKNLHENNSLSNPITEESMIVGQCPSIPSELLEFYIFMYTGSKDEASERNERYIESSVEDDIYKATGGKVKPSKHILLGMGLKSITGSRKVQEVINHFGHCIGYHTAEEYETEIAATIIQNEKVLPDGLEPRNGLSTNSAWDNYDESMYHDTQGIVIQNEVPAPATLSPTATVTPFHSNPPSTISVSSTNKTQKKRSLEVPNIELEPVRKKLRVSQFSFDITDMNLPGNYNACVARDVAWTISCTTNIQVPMWSGRNSTITKDDLPSQKIGYLANIGAPPTQHDVVNETMKRNVTLADECHEDYIVTTYGLAIAKPACQLQNIMQPRYDKVFVCFGAFHIMFRYLSAVGYITDASGAAHILIESGTLTKGSLNAFVSGKHYNQSRRMHVLLATAMRRKHIDFFLQREKLNESYEHLVEALKTVQASPTPDAMAVLEQTTEYCTFMMAYENFYGETRTGEHGVNAQFWRNYIDMVDIYLLFSRAVRTNDVDLFIVILGKMIDIFFAANRHNYARYMCFYYHRLLNIETTHPGLKKQLQRVSLSVRLSSNSFARQPVDQALESTINADAASRQTGITSFHQIQGATRRWTVTRSARSNIVRHLFEKAAIKRDTNPSHETRKSKVSLFHKDLENISKTIDSTMNPFVECLLEDRNLYCLADGKKMTDKVKHDMLNVFVLGRKWKDEFIKECLDDPTRFERPLQRRKVSNFASSAIKTKIRGKDEKIIELRTTRDLMGRLVYLACTKNI